MIAPDSPSFFNLFISSNDETPPEAIMFKLNLSESFKNIINIGVD